MTDTTKCLLILVALATLGGCQTAMELEDANEQLTSFYYAKSQAKGDPAMEETAIASLRDLGRATAERARTEKDPVNKISFYRVAATAAWQAQDVKVLEYTAAGSAVCENNWSSAPRDCGMLTFIDNMAAIDETTARFNDLRSSGNVSAQDAINVFDAYQESAIAMIETRSELASSVPASLLKAYDERLDDLVCSKIGVGGIGLAATAGASIDGACRLGNLRLQAKDAGLALPHCTGAVPASVQSCD